MIWACKRSTGRNIVEVTDNTSLGKVEMSGKGGSRVGAIILAAGKSTRMGETKQLLLLGEKTVLGQTIENVRDSEVDEVVLVLGSSAEVIRQQLPVAVIEGLKIVINQDYGQGMATSLREGIAALDPQVDAALIVLADQPFVRPQTLDRLIEQHRRGGAQIVIPSYRGFRGNPVLLDRSIFSEAMALSGDIGCRAIFGTHSEGIVKVEVPDLGILLDIDSQEDYARLQSFGQSRQGEKTLIEAATQDTRVTPSEGELIVVGWEAIAAAIVKLGKLLNFGMTVVDPLLKISDVPVGVRLLNTLDLSLLPEALEKYVVVASRGKFDEDALEQAFHIENAYVGLVANKKRGQEICRSLEGKGVPAEKLKTLRVPAGLDIGAKTPEEIALSIMAEVVSRRAEKRQ
jgi:molybdenum cofactor cytidylyltransferase